MESPVEASAISPFFHVFLIIDTHSNLQTMQKRFTACPHDNNTEEHNYRSSGYYFIFVAVSVGEISSTERERKTRNGSERKQCRNGELEKISPNLACAQTNEHLPCICDSTPKASKPEKMHEVLRYNFVKVFLGRPPNDLRAFF